ncbi:hypothetical protein VC83_05560 [Pseudogymnoascus destructans]|uniref:Oxidoreductase n=2 Tax=Pseudogymnoascus destructans TaxID=655981 RepID=L8G979_PSED2|nr:uncharacterized protein VC83_05560 [Pseudogymnoascus destructans]ELR09193.1 hypothetical protein GMDG_03770 [Pseudogymnoascus destructans 20631-21]OAF57599.1 hypothetical protein VC83_05560 [Pseudogymnoascus destructans]
MIIPLIAEAIFNGISFDIDYWNILKVVGLIAAIVLVKLYCRGATNLAERQLHSKVVIVTGGTTGIGAEMTLGLAQRGAQIVLLTRQPASDPFIVDYIEDLRTRTNNELIYAEQVDLASTHSIRKFATKWIDNAPPRRLDMIVLCAASQTAPGKPMALTSEGIEETWMVNYLANFHLLSILSPAIRAQPPDRDVRILFTTCSSYISSPVLEDGEEALDARKWSPGKAYARSKLALMVFGQAFQKHLDAYKRPDGLPMNARVVFVDPGYSRTSGMRRWLSRGTLWGLALYVLLWHQAWLFLKSAEQGAQSLLYAAMDVTLGRGNGGKLIKECIEVDLARKDVRDEETAKKLWQASEKLIERVEREEAVKRALKKKEMAEQEAEQEDVGKGSGTDAGNVPEKTASGNKKSKSRKNKKAAA